MYKKQNKSTIKGYLKMLNDCAQITNNKNSNKMEEINNNTPATTTAPAATTDTTTDTANFSFAASYNGGHVFDIDTSNFEFCKLADLYTDKPTVYALNGLWCNDGKYGRQGVLICAELGKLVNAPMHYTSTIEAILKNPAAVNAINSGKVGFSVYKYTTKNRECYGIRFKDVI